MTVDILALASFYDTPLGGIARRFVGRALADYLGRCRGERMVALGYATPFLDAASLRAERLLALMPAAQGVTHWPLTGPGSPNASSLVDPMMLPLTDVVADRVLLVHALENVLDPESFMGEIWRVLAPHGRGLLVVPNRRGLWAQMDTTPFGHGKPYSRSQLKDLLRKTQFVAQTWTETLYVPPLASRTMLSTAGAWERVGTRLGLPFAGVHVVEVSKQLHRPVSVRKAVRPAFAASPVLVPKASTAAPRLSSSRA